MLLYGGVFFPARLVPTTVSVFRLDRSESDNEPLRESKRYQVNGLGPTKFARRSIRSTTACSRIPGWIPCSVL